MSRVLLTNLVRSNQFFLAAGGRYAIIVRHWRCTGQNGTGGTVEEFANALNSRFAGLWENLLDSAASYEKCSGQIIDLATNHPTSLAAENSPQTPETGVVTGEIMPGQVAGVVTLQTSFPGKSYRGRLYMPFASEDDSVNGKPGTTYKTNLGTMAGSFIGNFLFGSGGNESIVTSCVYSVTNHVATTIQSLVVRPFWGTQRKRRRSV